MPLQPSVGQRTGATFRDFVDAFTYGLTLKHLGREPRDIPSHVGYFAGDLLPWLLAYEATAPAKALKLAPVLREMLRWGTASAATELGTKGSDMGDVALSAASGAAFPPIIAGGGAGGRLIGRGLRSLVKRALPVQGAVERFGPTLGPMLERVFSSAAQRRLQASEHGLISRFPGMEKLLQTGKRSLGAAFPQVLGALEHSTARLPRPTPTGEVPSELLQRVMRRFNLSPEQAMEAGRQSFARGAGIAPEHTGYVGQLRAELQRQLAGEQAQRRYAALLKEAGVSAGPGAATAIRGVAPEVRQSILERYPIQESRLWHTYFPRSQPASYIVLAKDAAGEWHPPWEQRPLARTLDEANQRSAAIATQLGIPQADLRVEPMKADLGEYFTQMSRPAYFGTIDRAAKQMGIPREDAMDVLQGLRIRRPFARGKFMGPHVERKGLLPEVLPEQREAALLRRFHQSNVFKGTHVPLTEASRIYPKVEEAFGGPEAAQPRYLKRWMQDIAGQPTELERRWADHVNRLATVPGPFQPIFQKWAGDPFQLRRAASTLRGLQAMTKLGFSLASPLANLLGGTNNVFAKKGANVTLRAMYEALHNPREWGFLSHEVGIQPAMLSRAGLPEMPAALSGMVRASMVFFGETERMVRKIAAIAGYLEKSGGKLPSELLQSNTKLHREALANSWQTVLTTQFHYGKENLPEILRGPVGQTLGQFKPFLLNQVAMILDFTPQEAFRFFTAMGVLTGLGAVPLVENADEIVFNTLGVGLPPARWMRDIRTEHPRLAAGLPGALGFDIGGSIGVAEHFLPTNVADLLLGPSFGDVERGVSAVAKGEPVGRALASTIRGARGIAQAQGVLQGGAVRQPVTRELLYKVAGGRYKPLRGRSAAESRRLNVPELLRALQGTPGPFRGELARLLPAVQAAQKEQGPKELALLLALGFQPTGLKSTRAAQRRYYELQKTYKREEQKGTPRGRRRF